MNPAEIISRKRDGLALAADEIAFFVSGYTQDIIPDYQMAALLMAIFHRDMNPQETAALTRAMLDSGQTMRWPDKSKVVDKHSTGGIGDKTSLILAPLLACCGLRVPMISGRGLGPTGGTLDKLEAIPGLRTNLSLNEIRAITNQAGCVITGASEELAPADRRIYGLRDVTGTVPCIPLITSSIMSKKLAEGLDALVLDVKFGNGAFMKTRESARRLAETLVDVGHSMEVTTVALLTDMNQPLGRMAGNAVEVHESIAVLRGTGPPDVRELVLALGAELLVAIGSAATNDDAVQRLATLLDSGRAFEKFQEMVTAQGGDPDAALPVATATELLAGHGGFISEIDTERLGYGVISLGGGRRLKTDRIDHSVGFEILVRIGDEVEAGQPLLRIFANPVDTLESREWFDDAISISPEPVAAPELIVERIAASGND